MKLKIKQKILLVILFIFTYTNLSLGNQSITYNFAVLFLAKTCDVSIQNEIYIENTQGSGIVTNSSIKNDNAIVDVKLGLSNCTSPDISNSKVYISDGNTLTNTTDFFNDDPTGIIGLQITDGNTIFSKSSTLIPDSHSIVWENITSVTDSKTLKARLRCKTPNCEPQDGDFSASLVFNYYID